MSTTSAAWDSVPKFEADELHVDVLPGGSLVIKGSLTLRDPPTVLAPVLRSLHQAALHDGLQRVTVDVSELSFVNSSGIRVFVDWVLWLRDEASTRRYTLVLRSTSDHAWQRASLPVLQSLAPGCVQIERC